MPSKENMYFFIYKHRYDKKLMRRLKLKKKKDDSSFFFYYKLFHLHFLIYKEYEISKMIEVIKYSESINNNIGVIRDISNIINSEVGVKYENLPTTYQERDYFSKDGYKIFFAGQIQYRYKNR
jgi:hypothetical protein